MSIRKLNKDNFIDTIKIDIIMIAIISFLGFLIENIWMFLRFSCIDNRNMYLPFLLGYGLLINVIYYFIGTPGDILKKTSHKSIKYIVYFLSCFVIVSVGEILLGTIIFKTGGYDYWNYLGNPMHITKYTSVPTSTAFAIIITLIMKYIYLPIRKKIESKVSNIPLIFVIIIAIALLTDFFISFKNMYENGGSNGIWKINTGIEFPMIRSLF